MVTDKTRTDDGLPTVEALRAAIQTSDDEPLESDGFCAHGVIGGAGCSEWEHGWIERVHRRLSGSGLNASESPPTCDALDLCVLPKGHEGKHETNYERVSRVWDDALTVGDASESGQPPEAES